MKKLNQCLLAIVCMLFFSCKKETTYTTVKSSTQDAAAVLTAAVKWQGAFVSYNGLPGSGFIPDNLFIRNGYARIHTDSVKIHKKNYYSTRFRLLIPASVNIKGDSLNVEVGLKNPSNSSFYSPYYGRDITIYLKGETNEASITNTATNNINPGAQERAGLKFGQIARYNLPQFQYNFEDYGSFILQTFNRGLVAYRNDAYVGGLSYADEPLIGKLKEIGVVFKGSGFIDYINVYNSVNNKLLMSEDFNTDGKSTIIIW